MRKWLLRLLRRDTVPDTDTTPQTTPKGDKDEAGGRPLRDAQRGLRDAVERAQRLELLRREIAPTQAALSRRH